MWGLTETEEQAVLRLLKPFEEEKIPFEDVETEELHFHYTSDSSPRIYNGTILLSIIIILDVITLRSPSNPLMKLTISHAISQSAKLALFEELISLTIHSTKHIPLLLSETGVIRMTRTAINQKIGQLFIMRINVNLVSNVLDCPEIFWSEPGIFIFSLSPTLLALEPVYTAIRGYLEINQRVDLLNNRVSVISDLLDMLKDHLNSSHGEQLEWIVIVLIAFEILIGLITIAFDWYGYHKEAMGGASLVREL